MHALEPQSDNPLEAAASQMRNLCRGGESLPDAFNLGSIGRMLVHIENIGRSVAASKTDHVNAAKRLNDFAIIFARVARNSGSANRPLADRLTSVSDNLRAASEQLSRAEAFPEGHATDHGVS